MKKTLLILSLSSLALTACSKPNQTPTNAETASQATALAASQTPATETSASQATTSEVIVTQVDSTQPPVEGNAQTSLDWNGTYKGVLPCANCDGIETKLTLNEDKTYVISELYQGKGDTKPFESKGKFSFDKTGNIVTLDATDKRQYFVSENRIIALDQEGKIIQGNLAKNYELQKQNP